MTTERPTTTIVAGGTVVLPGGGTRRTDVTSTDGRIVEIGDHRDHGDAMRAQDATVIDASGCLVAPGFVDLQINGGWGHDFTADPNGIAAVARHLPSTGVTSFLPTVVTSRPPAREAALDALTALDATATGSAAALGLHFEGPMISPVRRGAHDARFVATPDPGELSGWSPDAGVRMVTIAPELPGHVDVIRELTGRGVIVAIGHTDCSAAQFAAAVGSGASMVTHLYNAMRPFAHREPGPIGATLADDTVSASVICDGLHVDPVAVAMAWRALGRERFVLVTDAMAALGLDIAATNLASLNVTVDATGVRTSDGVLAGSNLSLDQAVRNLVSYAGCSAIDAIGAATTNPANVLGLVDRGRVEVGARADLVLLDEDLHVARTIIGGTTTWKS